MSRPLNRIALAAVVLAAALDFAANWLAAHYLVPVGDFLIPGGTFVFAFSFVVYDYLRRIHGRWYAVAAIVLGFVASIAYTFAFGGNVGRIAIAGLVALACSSSVDYAMQSLTLRRPIWQYVMASNGVSLAVDTAVFTALAFALLPVAVQVHIGEGQYLAKLAVSIAAIPLVYGARTATARFQLKKAMA